MTMRITPHCTRVSESPPNVFACEVRVRGDTQLKISWSWRTDGCSALFVICVRSSSLARLSEEGRTVLLVCQSFKSNVNELSGEKTERNTAEQKSAAETRTLDVLWTSEGEDNGAEERKGSCNPYSYTYSFHIFGCIQADSNTPRKNDEICKG